MMTYDDVWWWSSFYDEFVDLSSDDVFCDVGSGIGNVVLQVVAQTGCQVFSLWKNKKK